MRTTAILGPEFLLTSLIVVLMPGTGVVYTIGMVMAHGRRSGLIAAMGCTLGIVPHMLAAVCGLSALLNASAIADYKETSLSSLVEGLVLHGIEGEVAITDPATLATLEQLRAAYGLQLRAEHSHRGAGLD